MEEPFGAWVRRRRDALSLTQEMLAERAQVSVRTVRNIEMSGTGRPRAHTRRQITEALAGAPPARPAQLPHDVVGFVGREAEQSTLDELLTIPAAAPVCVVSGMPGVGKTSLAVHWAHRVRAAFPDGQLYVNLHGHHPTHATLDPDEVLRGFLDALAAEQPQRDVGAHFRSRLAGKRMLVLLDDARDADQVRPLLPGVPGCVTVVTSRAQTPGLVAVDGARALVLAPCRREEGRDLLAARVGTERVRADRASADRIVDHCGRLPLALAIVGARAALHPAFALSAIADELDAGSRLDLLDAGEPTSDVRSAFAWSYDRLGEDAARMLRVLGQLPRVAGAGVAAAASAAGWPPPRARRALRELTRASLVLEPAPARFTLHDLVHEFAADRGADLDPPSDRARVRARIVHHFLSTAVAAAVLLRPHRPSPAIGEPPAGVAPEPLTDGAAAVAWYAAARPALLTLIRQADRDGADLVAAQLAAGLAPYLERRAQWPQLAAVGSVALAAATRLDDPVGQLDALSMTGRAHMHQDEHGRALDCYTRALRLATRLGKPAELAVAHFDLALLSDSQGRPAEALEHVSRAHRHYRAAGDRAGQAFALNAMAWDHIQLDQPDRAPDLCRQAIALYREVANPHGEAATWDTLGLAQFQLGRYDEAARSYRAALAPLAGTGDHHLHVLVWYRLGTAYDASGDRPAAREAWRRAGALLDTVNEGGESWTEGLRTAIDERLSAG